MPFMAGYFLLNPEYREGEKRKEVADYLSQLGFEIYDVGLKPYLIFYLEAPSTKDLDEITKMAESHPGVLKAYVAMGVLASDEKIEELAKQLESGEVALDESFVEYLKFILANIRGKG